VDNDVAAGSTATIAGGDSLSLVVFPLTAAGGGRPGKVSYGLLFVALLLLAVAAFAGAADWPRRAAGSVSSPGCSSGTGRPRRRPTGRRLFRGAPRAGV